MKVIGCFLPNSPDDTHLLPGPSYRKFLERSYEHVKQSHPHTRPNPSPSVKRTSGITQILLNTSAAPPVKKLVLSTPPEPPKSGVSKQRTLTSKFGRKTLHIPITNFVLGQRKSLKEESKYPCERFGKAHCLMTVHQGVNQKISNESIFGNYELAVTSMKKQYLFQKQCLENEGHTEALKVQQPPIRYALSKGTIYDCVSAITEAYRKSPDCVYKKIDDSFFWGFSHDLIIKFGNDYLGVFIQGCDRDETAPVSALHKLAKIKGGHSAVDIANYLTGIITGYLSVPNSAFHCIGGILDENEKDYNPMVKPPEYMKLGTIQRVDIEAKEIYIELKNMPVANTGDGVFSNMKAARLLVLCYGLETLHFWCATHSTDLVLKRMATSKTMCVPQVVTTYDALRPVVKHFEKSTKSKDILDKSTSILGLKQMKLISWGGTQMGHFMSACQAFRVAPCSP